MTGALYIDGIDAFANFGVFVHDGGYNGVAQWPALKAVDSNEWPEDDGVEVDLTAPKLDTRTFGIDFAGVRELSFSRFVEFLSDGAYHEFDFREIGLVRTLRMVSAPSRETVGLLKKFTLQFSDDDPTSLLTTAAPTRIASCWQEGYEVDDRPLSDYGVWVTDGTHDEITKSPSVKQNSLVNTPAISGAVYDGANVVFQPMEARIRCNLAADPATFWVNYIALLRDLIQPNERVFRYFRDLKIYEFPCYYRSANVTKMTVADDRIWCDFEITLVFTSPRVAVDYVLSTEDGHLIVTEDTEHAIATRTY